MADSMMGSVSHGTMRAEDLIPAFMTALDAIREGATFQPGAGHPVRVAAHGRMDDEFGEMERRMRVEGYFDSDEAYFDLERLFDLLSEYAPEGTYFGAHEGDGSDYGFWPIDPEDD